MELMNGWGVDVHVLSPSSSLWLLNESSSSPWTADENKLFEEALAVVNINRPDAWETVASFIPGKTIDDILTHYKDLVDDISHIEAGLIPLPGYTSSSVTLDWENNHACFDDRLLKHAYAAATSCGKRHGGRLLDHERKKGIPWTEHEHRQFLVGLQKYGKGDWRSISRNCVTSRTPTQVASHAQKFFQRKISGGKDKRRSSIHDITLADMPDASPSRAPSPPSPPPAPLKHRAGAVDFSEAIQAATPLSVAASQMQMHSGQLLPPCYGMTPFELKLQAQNPNRHNFGSLTGNHNMFQMLPAHLSLHG